MKLQEKLNKIQQELKAPKGQFNKFGKYNYRSLEDILTAVKPLLEKAILIFEDEMVAVGEKIYVKATVTLKEDGEEIKVSAYAREAEAQAGMADAQITGSTSSYARKYAVNGLFLIDDNKDDDSRPPKGGEQIVMSQVKKELAELKTHAEATAYYKKHVGKGYDELLVARGKELVGK